MIRFVQWRFDQDESKMMTKMRFESLPYPTLLRPKCPMDESLQSLMIRWIRPDLYPVWWAKSSPCQVARLSKVTLPSFWEQGWRLDGIHPPIGYPNSHWIMYPLFEMRRMGLWVDTQTYPLWSMATLYNGDLTLMRQSSQDETWEQPHWSSRSLPRSSIARSSRIRTTPGSCTMFRANLTQCSPNVQMLQAFMMGQMDTLF